MPRQQHPAHFFHSRQQLLLQLFWLFTLQSIIVAEPLANPEINSKSVSKSNNNLNSNQQNQQQQQKSNTQDAHLNSLNAYSNYDTIMQNAQQQINFKPSYKLPEMETNFTPIQTANSPELPPGAAPVLMQYIPQPLQEGGVQYLQLIPTRPLIVPISQFLNGQGAAAGQHAQTSSYLPTLQAPNNIDYQAHTPTVLKSLPANTAPQPPAPQPSLVNMPLNLPYGLQTYGSAYQPYRNNFRYHREIRDKHMPHSLSLNLNEYIPGQGGAIQRPAYNIRGRP